MKTQPTEIDCQAVQLFTPAPGMHVAYSLRGSVEWGRCIMTEAEMKLCSEYWTAHTVVGVSIVAIDTDDPATVGVMLAQVEAAAGCQLKIADAWSGDVANAPDMFAVCARTAWCAPMGWDTPPREYGRGVTRMDALVAAMMAIKSAAK